MLAFVCAHMQCAAPEYDCCIYANTWHGGGLQVQQLMQNPLAFDVCRYDDLSDTDLQALQAHYGYPAYHPKTFKVSMFAK